MYTITQMLTHPVVRIAEARALYLNCIISSIFADVERLDLSVGLGDRAPSLFERHPNEGCKRLDRGCVRVSGRDFGRPIVEPERTGRSRSATW